MKKSDVINAIKKDEGLSTLIESLLNGNTLKSVISKRKIKSTNWTHSMVMKLKNGSDHLYMDLRLDENTVSYSVSMDYQVGRKKAFPIMKSSFTSIDSLSKKLVFLLKDII